MPKYTSDIIAGYTLYFTTKCIVEAMHVHASNKELSEIGSVKLFVYENGDTRIENWGTANEYEMNKIRKYIKNNYEKMYDKWKKHSDMGYYKSR
jgi:hypothetical protein